MRDGKGQNLKRLLCSVARAFAMLCVPAFPYAAFESRRRSAAPASMLMYHAASRLDHIQDSDPESDPVFAPEVPSAIRYNLVFGYYILATSLLDQLSANSFAPCRLLRLRALWTEQMLRMASG